MAAALSTGSALKAAVSLKVQPKLEVASTSLRPVSRAFGLKTVSSRVSCSLQDDVQSFVQRCAEVGKVATISLAASALIGTGAAIAEGVPGRLTYDEINSKTYLEVKGSGTANQCPVIAGGTDSFEFKAGDYYIKKLCLEPTSFTVKAEGPIKQKGAEKAFQNTKLMTRLTYTLDEVEGPFSVGSDGSIKFVEKDGIDYAAVTVQLPGGERVPFLFTIKELVAEGTPESFSGKFTVPSYRGSSFLDPKGRGGSTGYDNAVALIAGGAGDEEDLAKENIKNTEGLSGEITFSVAKTNTDTGEIAGVFESLQPSDTDLGSKAPKEVKIQGIFYGQLEG
eukprot:TRINITY_DN6860_c0_g1_i1.p1 TRINITY_DN6860_c0_g1~~TRINITY_DN6860_c0_g1_i1.p1  ORF type:complete len:375 (+),score=76.53 TRINITY_DN6860_c0_g1_i1:118-1125(+)